MREYLPGSAAAIPPLPDVVQTPDDARRRYSDDGDEISDAEDDLEMVQPLGFLSRSLKAGCWLCNYTPVGSGLVTFDGTIRIERHNASSRTASGDLYQRGLRVIGFPPRPVLAPAPKPQAGIPILPRRQYRHYMRVTQLLEGSTRQSSFTLAFELYRFEAATGSWTNQGVHRAKMTWVQAPAGYPDTSEYLEGDVRNPAAAVVGRLKMGWVSTRFRKASLEIDTVAGSERPVDNGAGLGWANIFNAINWEMNVLLGDTNVVEPSGQSWSDGEMHAAMLARRDAVNLDTDWRYHILAVKRLDSTERGIMYDAYGTDSNNVPREGVGISTHWIIPNADPWGLVKGQRFGASPAVYFRTAIHELGHAFGLFHNTVDNGFMNTTNVIAEAATAASPFPNNIKWSFTGDELKRLRHYPDIFIRPGGTAFGTASTTAPPITPTDFEAEMPGLELRVTPLLAEVPIGAPVRVRLELANIGDEDRWVPARLSLKTDFVRGYIVDPSGLQRSFSPLVHCIEDKPMRLLRPGKVLAYDLTLLRGADGALFPSGGLHEIVVEVTWEVDEAQVVVRGATSVLITGAENAEHAAAAHRLLATPDALLVLALGGDHLPEGVEAVQAGIKSDVLRPHYAVIEAKRLAGLGGHDAQAKKLVEADIVMSPSEGEKLQDALGIGKADKAKASAPKGAAKGAAKGKKK